MRQRTRTMIASGLGLSALVFASAAALARLIADPETWAPPRDLRPDQIGGVPLRKA